MTILKFPDLKSRSWPPGPSGVLLRVRDLIDRGRLDVGQLRLNDILGWLLAHGKRTSAPLGELCGVLESGARLMLVKSRRLTGLSEEVAAEELEPWAGPPPELPLRRSWLAERIAGGPHAFAGPLRTYDAAPPDLIPIAPDELRLAMLAALNRARRPIPVLTPKVVRISVEHTSARILAQLAERGEVQLAEVAGDSRDAQVAAFLACLTLARQGRISLVQDELFGQISIWPATDVKEALA